LEIERRVASTGRTPLEAMLEAMRFYYEKGNIDKAAAFAKDAAPYVHPRMAASKLAANLARLPIETREVSSVELARRIAFILGQAAREQADQGV
jgi:hypothetical protein